MEGVVVSGKRAKQTEAALLMRIRAAVVSTGKATLWRNSVGKAEHAPGKVIRYGLAVGSADLVGFRHSDGRFVGIEVKTEIGRLSDEQKKWLNFTRQRGCLTGVARSVEEAMLIVFPEAPISGPDLTEDPV